MKIYILLFTLLLYVFGSAQITVFSENMGPAVATTPISTYTGFENYGVFTFAGTGEIRSTSASNGYPGASGANNVMLNSSGETLVVDGISAAAYMNLVLSFGVRKGATASDGSSLILEYSTTGSAGLFTPVAWPGLPTGVGTAVYTYRSTIAGMIPNNVTTIRFKTTDAVEYRIDDLRLAGDLMSNAEIDIKGNGVSIVDNDTTPSLTDATDFGTSYVGNTIFKTFTIHNTGSDLLNLTGIHPYVIVSGANASDFSVSIVPTSPVAALTGITTFEITFQPSAIGLRTAVISIANNDGNENPYNFVLQGAGIGCAPTTSITSVTPVSGPSGTLVTVNGVGFNTVSAVKFGALNAVFTVVSDTLIFTTVPENATTGEISIQDNGGCIIDSTMFTVIKENNTSCAPAAIGISELFISQVTDASSGSLSYVELFNATTSSIDLANYTIRFINYNAILNDGKPPVSTEFSLTAFMLNPGDTFTFATSVGSGCSVVGGNAELAQQTHAYGGMNNNDCVSLLKLGDVVDIWGACSDTNYFINDLGLGSSGYNFVRKVTATPLPATTFNAADWDIMDFNACNDDYSNIDFYAGVRISPLTTSPVITLNCQFNSAQINVTGSESVLGGATLVYQWFMASPGDIGWTPLTNTGVYSNVNTNVLSISNLSGLNGCQYYCKVMEGTDTCYKVSNAIILVLEGMSTTWNGMFWDNGIPTLSTAVVINGNYNTATNGNFSSCNLTVNETGTLIISSGGYVEVQNAINNSGSITIENKGQLIQINETDSNSGNYTGAAFQVKRSVDNIRSLDYVYWSAPVANYAVSNINGSLYYYWNTTTVNPNGTQGYWLAATGLMEKGQGYIVRGPSSFTSPQTLTVNFTGKPFNGQFTYPITRGTDVSSMNDNLILVGNPYPSAIDADVFFANNPNIEGAVHIWTHGTLPDSAIVSPFYQNFAANYTMNDYIVYNKTATTIPQAFNGKIASGQGFFIKINEAGAIGQTITFNNAMRGSSATAILDNSLFFKDANNSQVTEKNRIWLDLISASNSISTTVVGYVSGATMEKDNCYDAFAKLNSGLCFYSRLGNDAIHIQGRALPFTVEDKIALGMEIPATGSHKIAIRHVDGLFSGSQNIYLQDNKFNIIHDLKANPYLFTVDNPGFVNDRFVLRFTNNTLENDDFEAIFNSIKIYINQTIVVSSISDRIKEVVIYDVLGRVIVEKKNTNSTTIEITSVRPTQSVLIVKVTLENGRTVTKKILY